MLFKTKGFTEPKGSKRDFEGGFFGISSTLIDAHTLPGQTEGLKVGCVGKNKVFIKPLALGWFAKVDNVFLRLGGFAKVDNSFGYEKWA